MGSDPVGCVEGGGMTDLVKRSTRLRFTTSDEQREQGKYRRVMVEALPGCAVIRLSGLRTSYTIPWSAVYSLAVKAAVASERAEKARKKAGK